jgi:hypothetical protein
MTARLVAHFFPKVRAAEDGYSRKGAGMKLRMKIRSERKAAA